MEQKKIDVSILCICYNQSKYIREAIDSFLSQETKGLNIEIIINDDCSTDGTQKILYEYENKYPNQIKVIYHDENQWKKKKGGNLARFLYPIAKGKYIALCEGDDFWIDKNKIQKQYDLLEKYENIACSFHNASIVNSKNEDQEKLFFDNKKMSSLISAEQAILDDFIPTASLFFRNYFIDEGVPEYFFNEFCGDLPLRLFLASKGDYHYLNEVMSIYRINIKTSASGRIQGNRILTSCTMKGHIDILKSFNKETNNRFFHEIREVILTKEVSMYYNDGNFIELFKKKYNKYTNLKMRLKCIIIHFFNV